MKTTQPALLVMGALIAASSAACSSDPTAPMRPPVDGGANADADAGASEGEFSALTYNVAGLPEGLSGSHPATNTQYISPLLNDYDLVLVQEDWLTPDPNPYGASLRVFHDVLASAATHAFQSTPAPCPIGANPARPSALVSDGLNEFSRFAFRDLQRVAWEGCFGGLGANDNGASDCGAMKGFSVAAHEFAPGVTIDVYTLHGEAGSTAMDQSLQEADYRQLAVYINEHSRGHAVIVGGDTNLHTESSNPDAAIWQNLLATTDLTDVCRSVDCGQDATIIDKFAYRDGDDVSVAPLTHHFERDKFVGPDQMPLSDHDALTVRFRWHKLR